MKSSNQSKNEEITLKSSKEIDIIFVFTKKVKEDAVRHSKIEREKDIKKIKDVISKFPTGSQKKFEEIDLNTNPKQWIRSLIDYYTSNVDKEKMENLINDFTDSMKTRMREEEKYAIGILLKDELVLCHSYFGEETITPEWKVIPRMLDADNVMRYVRFLKGYNGTIIVKYYEKYSTDSFVDWLGLPQRDALYHFGGKYRISTEINNIVTTLEIPIEKIDKWIDEHPEIKKSEIDLPSPITKIKIVQIRVGRKKYDNPGDFLQDLYAEKYNIDYYKEKFKEISESLEPYLYQFFDEKDSVTKVMGDKTIPVVRKINPNFDIVFCFKSIIKLRESYLDDLLRKFANDEPIDIFHAGSPFSSHPLEIKSLKIWNKITQTDITKKIIKYLHNIDLKDRNIMEILEFTIFNLLSADNQTKPIHYFFKEFERKKLENLNIGKQITKLEDDILEYKSRDYFVGNNNEIIKKIGTDLKKKLEKHPWKIYLIGVEDNGRIDPIPNSRLPSDRTETIKQKIKEIYQVDTIYLIPVPVSCADNGSIIILIGGIG